MQATFHKYEMTILEHHLDTFGHVNNATYLEIMEQARWDWITKRNFGLDVIQKNQQGPIILDIHIQFKKELRLRDSIVIETQTLTYEKKIGKVSQKILSQDGVVMCEAVFTFGLFDMRKRKIISPTEDWLFAVGYEPAK